MQILVRASGELDRALRDRYAAGYAAHRLSFNAWLCKLLEASVKNRAMLRAANGPSELERFRSRAVAEVSKAIKRGDLVRPEVCEQCGKPGNGAKINAHHDDYEKPLDVRWLCVQCHKRHHVSLGAK